MLYDALILTFWHTKESFTVKMFGLSLFSWAPFSPHHNSEPFVRWLIIACSFSPPSGPLLLKKLTTYTHLLLLQPLCPLSVPSSFKLFCREKGQESRRRSDVSLSWLPAFFLLDQSHLWLRRRCVWDTAATVHSLIYVLLSGHKEKTQHIHALNSAIIKM